MMTLIEFKFPGGATQWLEPHEICECGIYKKANKQETCYRCAKMPKSQVKEPKKTKSHKR